VLQRVAACCSAWHGVAVCSGVLQRCRVTHECYKLSPVSHANALRVAVCCSVLQRVAVRGNLLPCVEVCCRGVVSRMNASS